MKKKPKKRPPAPVPAQPDKRDAKTPNGKLIQALMQKRGMKSADYRDFVVLTEGKVIDWKDSWEMYQPDGTPLGVSGIALVHKSKLRKIFGESFAAKLWHQGLHRRV